MEKYDYSTSKATYSRMLLEEATREFHYRSITNLISVNFDAQGVPQDSNKLFRNHTDLTLADIQRSAALTWGNRLYVDGTFNHIIDEMEDNPDIL